jgi:TM2 domain-containing membrane protein YozV
VQSNTGLDISICNGAVDALEAALFGAATAPAQMPSSPTPPVYQAPQAGYSPPPQYQQQQYQPPAQQYQQYQAPPPVPPYQQQQYQAPPTQVSSKEKGLAVLLYIFLGEFGAHYFYVKNVSRGLICLAYNIGLLVMACIIPIVGLIAWLLVWIVGLVQLCNWQEWLAKHSK